MFIANLILLELEEEEERKFKKRKREIDNERARKEQIQRIQEETRRRMEEADKENVLKHEENYRQINTTLRLKWNKNTIQYEEEDLRRIMELSGKIETILCKPEKGEAIVAYERIPSAKNSYTQLKGHTIYDFDIEWVYKPNEEANIVEDDVNDLEDFDSLENDVLSMMMNA
eukprot:TRINITY_DN1146_c0_g1_i1.p1 TRINITY_DN1146_c0_g1~~TRINITY_DN1146_c0_g1_i1.p1  ORF type:complete len:172 (-),score=51.39 TRINITY_DN1146_c0_g1_i1:36-551(-)